MDKLIVARSVGAPRCGPQRALGHRRGPDKCGVDNEGEDSMLAWRSVARERLRHISTFQSSRRGQPHVVARHSRKGANALPSDGRTTRSCDQACNSRGGRPDGREPGLQRRLANPSATRRLYFQRAWSASNSERPRDDGELAPSL